MYIQILLLFIINFYDYIKKQANLDKLVLPIGEDIKLFTNIIDKTPIFLVNFYFLKKINFKNFLVIFNSLSNIL